ncbi:MAG: hypothetical protein ACE5RH_02995 [Nitrosarchaeum sp.]
MKAELMNEKKKKFEPIKINITIENLDELIEMWKRMNIAPVHVDEYNDNDSWQNDYESKGVGDDLFFNILDNKIKEYFGDEYDD